MADDVRFINVDNASSGDGTTNETDSSADSAYISAASWEANEAVDLPAAGDTHLVNCDGSGADTGGKCELSTWTTGASNRLTMRGNAAALHPGNWDTGKYHQQVSDTFDGAIEINTGAEYCTIEALQVEQQGSVTDQSQGITLGMTGNTASDVIVRGCLVFESAAGTPTLTCSGISALADVNMVIVNNIVFGNWYDGIVTSFADTAILRIMYNNTVVDCQNSGITAADDNTNANGRYFNNVLDNNGTDWVSGGGNKTTGGNCTSDATSPETGLRNRTFTFINAAGDDYHLAASDTGASGTGTDLSADSDFAFNDDVDRVTRIAWDSGADEKVVGGVTLPIFEQHYRAMRA